MLPRRLLLPTIALLLAGGAAMMTNSWIQQQGRVLEPPPSQPAPARSVLVAATDVATGGFLQPGSVRWQEWPDGTLAEAYLLKGEATLDEVVGAVARVDLAAGQPILPRLIVKPGERGFLAAVLEPGMRALSITVDEASSSAGLILPGDRVDVIVTHAIEADTEGGGTQHHVSETVLEDVRVIAMGRKLSAHASAEPGPATQARTATLQVSAAGAERLAVVGAVGSLTLSLRSLARAAEPQPGRGAGMTWDSAVAPALLPRNQPFSSFALIRGRETQTIALPQGGTKRAGRSA
jgi:pilus assembly protein CpaB